MPGEPNNQFSFTRTALSMSRRATRFIQPFALLPPMLNSSCRSVGRLFAIALLAALVGCTGTRSATQAPTPRQDYQVYRQLVVSGITQVASALGALDNLCAEANRNPRLAYEHFAKAVERLEVDSITVREHTRAMRARGDAYFEHWEERMAGSDNPAVRQRAAEHREQLKQSFEAMLAAGQQVREHFPPFLAELQKLSAVLDQEPTLAGIAGQKDLILSADEKGKQVQEGLERILAEMNTITALLRAPEAADSH